MVDITSIESYTLKIKLSKIIIKKLKLKSQRSIILWHNINQYQISKMNPYSCSRILIGFVVIYEILKKQL